MSLRPALAAIVLLATACDEQFSHLTVDKTGGSTLARATDDGVRVPAGRMVLFRVTAHARDGARPYDATDSIELSALDANVVRLEAGVRVNTWAAFGMREGFSALDVRINGQLEDHLDIEVTPTPEEAQ